jgi:molybdenum cofactor cytidylyltransferase
MDSPFSAVIPAAGLSERMSTGKGMLLYDKDCCFAEHIISCFGNYGCNPIVMVINKTFNIARLKNCNFLPVINHKLNLGRSYSIHLGLQLNPRGTSCFIQNIDNPFLEKPLLDSLLEAVDADSYAVPVYEGRRGHPVLLGKRVAEHIRYRPYTMDFREELKAFSRIEVPYPDRRILWNINTPEDYTRFTEESRLYSKKR